MKRTPARQRYRDGAAGMMPALRTKASEAVDLGIASPAPVDDHFC
jgi:hypothetical protein